MSIDFTANISESSESGVGFTCEVYPYNYNENFVDSELIKTFPAGTTETIDNSSDIVIVYRGDSGSEVTGVSPDSYGAAYDPEGSKGFDQSRDLYYHRVNSNASGGYSSEVTLVTVETEPEPTNFSFNAAFVLDESGLQDLKGYDLYVAGGDNTIQINKSEFIINLIEIPFKIPDNILTESKKPVYIDNKDIGFKAKKLIKDIAEISFGKITVSGEGNSRDYEECEYTLILPYSDLEISLNPNKILDDEIEVTCYLNVYNGEATINVVNSNGENVASEKTKFGHEIPIKIYTEKQNTMGATSGLVNNITKAYVEVRKPEIDGSEFNLIKNNGVLNGVSGYVEVDEIKMDFNAISNEKELILNELSSGVYIYD